MSAELRPGSTIASYVLVAPLGEGGMGRVWRAHDERLDRDVALKLLAPQFSGDDEFRARFVRESRLAGSLRHPNVLPVFDAGESNGQMYIAMQLVEGPDLAALMDQRGRLSVERVASIVGQIAAALDAAHSQGLVHRDVKPGNVLVVEGGAAEGRDHAYLTDFGITLRPSATTRLTQAGGFLGTLAYVAPEQLEGKPVDLRTDIYSLGCVAYEMLTGVGPFERETQMAVILAHLHDPAPAVSQSRPALDPAVDEAVSRAMAKSPADRYARAGVFASALSAALLSRRASGSAASRTGASTFLLRPLPEAGSAATSPAEAPTTDRPLPDSGSAASRDVAKTIPNRPLPVSTGRWHRQAIAVAGVAGVVVIALLLSQNVLFGSPGKSSALQTATASGAAKAGASRTPRTAGTVTPAAVESANPAASTLTDGQKLLSSIPGDLAGTCTATNSAAGALAANSCPVGGTLAKSVSYQLFPTLEALDASWKSLVKSLGVQMDSGGCWDGLTGETDHTRGRLACTSTNGNRKVFWSDRESLVHGSVIGTKANGPDNERKLVDWWSENAVPVPVGPVFTAGEAALLDEVPADIKGSCFPYRHEALDGLQKGGSYAGIYFPRGDTAAVDCFPGSPPEVAFFRFDDAGDLDAWWQQRAADEESNLEGGDCRDGKAGTTTWDRGDLLCWVSSGTAQLRWTDHDQLVYGVLNASTSSISDAMAWWSSHTES